MRLLYCKICIYFLCILDLENYLQGEILRRRFPTAEIKPDNHNVPTGVAHFLDLKYPQRSYLHQAGKRHERAGSSGAEVTERTAR